MKPRPKIPISKYFCLGSNDIFQSGFSGMAKMIASVRTLIIAIADPDEYCQQALLTPGSFGIVQEN